VGDAGRGTAEMVVDARDMRHTVLRQLRAATCPSISALHVDWGVSTLDGTVTQVPDTLTPVFDGERCDVFLLTDPDHLPSESVTGAGSRTAPAAALHGLS